jgi:NAD(P)-dependent dehydrogenase (short-subunit alcohol dehydrogenase family)
VSFNLVSRGDVQGRPLHELSVEEVMAPLQGMRSTLITARAAARRMLEQGAGVILWLTSGSAVGAAPGMGGTGPADAATDNYMRQLARENGRAPRLQEVADAAAFLASDLASGTTGTILNVTAGLVSEQ